MIELAKKVLPNVTHNREVFAKELKKHVLWSSGKETDDLIAWCRITFSEQFPEIIAATFGNN